MSISRAVRRYTAIMLLCCIPLQATAALLLPCAMEEPATAACHSNSTDSEETAKTTHLQCHTCALTLLVLSGITVSPAATDEVPGSQINIGGDTIHFYHFTPPLLYRPPVIA